MHTQVQKQENTKFVEDKQLSRKNPSVEDAGFQLTDKRAEASQLQHMQTSAEKAPFAQDLVQLKELADEHADKQRQSFVTANNADAPFQLLKIDGKKITKSGETGRWLQGELKKFLLDNGMSPHGFVSYFKNKIVPLDDDLSFEDFLVKFKSMAEEELERVENLKQTRKKGDARIKSWTRVLKLNRPAWTEDHKEMSESGQDIRHIVRNATIKNAIYGEYQFQKQNENEGVFNQIAKILDVDKGDHPWIAMKNIYNKAYLNQLNLFSGGGGVNRVIGLTADALIEYGNGVAKNKIMDENMITEIYLHTDKLIQNQITATSEQGNKLVKGKEKFQEGMEEFYEIITDYLDGLYDQWLGEFNDEEDDLELMISGEIIDIGLNFGFDLPEESNPEQIKMLIKVEESLGDHKPGNPERLADTLYLFLTGEEASFDLETGEKIPDDTILYYRSGLMTGPVKIHKKLSENAFIVDLGNNEYSYAERDLNDGKLYAPEPEEEDVY
jgi:hypothetical protein